MLWIGLLSGTSVDGIDAAVVEIDLPREPARPPRLKSLRAFETYAFPAGIRYEILAMAEAPALEAEAFLRLDTLLGELFAQAALEIMASAKVTPREIAAIGSHGQTIRHVPARKTQIFSLAGKNHEARTASTLQIGDPAVIAERTGINTVARFRHRDMAAGGQGAPLVPVFHLALLDAGKSAGAVLNIGGIANVTVPATGSRLLLAFDTGPGNMVMDALVRELKLGNGRFDQSGELAAKGKVSEELLKALLQHPYFSRKPPKSTGREEFGQSFVASLLKQAQKLKVSGADFLATATALTAASAAGSIAPYLKDLAAPSLYVCGGGAHNKTLLSMLEERLAKMGTAARVFSTGELGYSPDAIEAMAFAYLAACHVAGVPGNIPSATGAGRAAVLGEMTPGGGGGAR